MILSTAMKHLMLAGLETDDIVYAIALMEEATGADQLGVFVEVLRAHDVPGEIAGPALLEVATAVVDAPTVRRSVRDVYTGARDSNRSRRGMGNKEWRRLREQIFERDGHQCQYCLCRTTDLTCDHIVPLVRGGTNDPTNLTTACRSCNSSKGDKLIAEWSPL